MTAYLILSTGEKRRMELRRVECAINVYVNGQVETLSHRRFMVDDEGFDFYISERMTTRQAFLKMLSDFTPLQ